MCGRFVQSSSGEALAQRFGAAEAPTLRPRFNVAPTQGAAVVRERDGRRHIDLLRFGLVPGWAEDLRIGARMINARSERIATAPAFRTAFRRRRCIVPVDGFYEWQVLGGGRKGAGKQPWLLRAADGAPLALAGVWESYEPAEGEPVKSFAIVTREAPAALRAIHDRVPVILAPGDVEAWLDPKRTDPEALAPLLHSTGVPLDPVPVSHAVNDVRHDDPSLVAPVPARGPEES